MIDNPFFIPYSSIGVKFGIPIGESYLSSTTLQNGEVLSVDSSDFSLDVAFAIGFEYNIKSSYDKKSTSSDDLWSRHTSHYIGLRLGYDLNVVSPIDTTSNINKNDFFHDNFSMSFTYRYLINHRWHGFQTV